MPSRSIKKLPKAPSEPELLTMLGPLVSGHMRKWIDNLSALYEMEIFTCHDYGSRLPSGVRKSKLFFPPPLGYLVNIFYLAIKSRREHWVNFHVHYASGYGLLGSFVKAENKIISVWGSDVFEFPKRSIIHQYIFQFVLRRYNLVQVTSKCLLEEVRKYSSAHCAIVPFGIDTKTFFAQETPRSSDRQGFKVGIAKSLLWLYGFKPLIQSIHALRLKGIDVSLEIAGDGPDRGAIEALVADLDLSSSVHFAGFLEANELAEKMRSWDAAVFPSERESFGLAAIEASACGVPVVLSEAPGYVENYTHGVDALLVEIGSQEDLTSAIEALLSDEVTRGNLAANASIISQAFTWEKCVELQLEYYLC